MVADYIEHEGKTDPEWAGIGISDIRFEYVDGWCHAAEPAPKGYLTQNGPDESLRELGLTEHPSASYPTRSRANVKQSDGTVLFGDVTTGAPN